MPPIVRLAGYNVDAELLSETLDILREIDDLSKTMGSNPSASELRQQLERIGEDLRSRIDFEAFTPETISAAYARISRDPSHVTELRRSARFSVARARKSNENIIFGLGHASVAEHASFNFDISHISRLAAEELQYHRLQSFTEKSQRYITIGEDYIVPNEILGTDQELSYRDVVSKLFSAYDEILASLHEHHTPDDTTRFSKTDLRDLETRAKEDARYLLPLCCSTQMGMTLNARNLEHLLWELSDHPLAEVRELGQSLHSAVGTMAPSLVKYTTRKEFPRTNRQNVAKLFGRDRYAAGSFAFRSGPTAELVDFDKLAEERIQRAFAFTSGRDSSDLPDSKRFWRVLFENLGPHDPVYREFEAATASFYLEMSATCYAQFKRHRLMTQLVQSYELQSAAVVPPAIEAMGKKDDFEAAIRRSGEAAALLPAGLSPYLLTNAHVKRIMCIVNARELYHLSRLRCDQHAQWEIQELAGKILELIKPKWPNLLALTGGKDNYSGTYDSFFKN